MEEALLEIMENTANMLRGMTLDPAIPVHAKIAMSSKIMELEAAVSLALIGEEHAESMRLASVSPSGWVSVSERIPDTACETLCFGPGLGIFCGEFAPYPSGGGSWVDDGEVWTAGGEVTHWQPLPDPPAEVVNHE